MKWIRYVVFILWLTAYSTSDDIPSETNEIDPKEAVRKLDPAIRQALLRAIDNLEKRVAEEEDYEKVELDEGIDEDPKSGHDLLKSLLDIVSTEKNLIGSLNSTSELAQLIEKSTLRASNQQLTRAIPAEITNDITGSDLNSTTVTKRPYAATRRRTTTEATTTTTKKAPTHNADGENIEVVEKQDIKIFQAPLITAFTVKHDEKGAEKEVIPIFEPPRLPHQSAILPSQSILTGSTIDSANKHPTSILLPTPNPSQQQFPTHQQGLSQEVPEHIRKNQSLPTPEKIPFNPSQSVFSVRQALPLSPVNPSQPNTINEFLLERQRQLEQQILQLQIQARRQQEQILLQQQLLLDQQRKQFFNSDSTNQIIAAKIPKVDTAVRPSLEVVPSVTQPPRFEYSVEQQLPVREAANFHQDFIGPSTGLQRTSFQIQPSNQIPFNPSNSQFSQSSPPVPLEVATFQHLPQRSFQPFNLIPPGPQNSIQSIGKIQQPDHSPQRTRHFRQESGTGNFFFHEPLRPPPFGAASTFNFNPFPLENVHFNGQFGGNF